MRFIFLFQALFLFAAAVLAHPKLSPRAIPPPKRDPFYKPPSGWEAEEPGTILRTRKVVDGLIPYSKSTVKAYQILYRTTGSDNHTPSSTVTTVLVPENPIPNKLVLYGQAQDSDASHCAPSYSFRESVNGLDDIATILLGIPQVTILDLGYIVTIPDHQGPMNAFAVGPLEARMAMDGARATLNFQKLGLSKKSQIVGHGYSGGAIVMGWASQLQPSYAPELNMVGWAFGGTPANITSLIEEIDGGVFGFFSIVGIRGLMNVYKNLEQWVTQRLTQKGRDALHIAANNCLGDYLFKLPFLKVLDNDYIKNGSTVLTSQPLRGILDDLQIGNDASLIPTAPVLMYHSLHDEIVPYSSGKTAAKFWGRHGADVRFLTLTSPLLAHFGGLITGDARVLNFINDRFNGKAFPHGLTFESVDNPLLTVDESVTGIAAAVRLLRDFFDANIGANDRIVKKKLINADSKS